MTDLFKNTPERIRSETGAQLRARREALGLRRSEVSTAAGFRNLSKGARRITEREAGASDALPDEAGYFGALQLEPTAIRARFALADEVQGRIQQLGVEVVNAERALLQNHGGRLRQAADSIARDPLLGQVRSPALALRMLWAGGGGLSLGTLVRAWATGALVADTKNNGRIYLFEGAGSALSGAGRCTGIDERGALRTVRQSPSRFLGREGLGLVRPQSAPGPLSLADALAALGATVPATRFHRLDADGRPSPTPIAIYDPHERRLHTANGATAAFEASAGNTVSVRSTYGGVSISGRTPHPVQLPSGWHLGAFESDELRCGSELRLTGGCIQGERGWLPVQVVGPSPPPGLLPLLSTVLEPSRVGAE